jgi:mRNA interferase MazF
MLLHKGDIVLANFPFTDLSQTKLRPAIVLYVSQPRDETTLCFISSQNVNDLAFDEFLLSDSDPEFMITGLRVSSKVRVTRITTLDRSLILRRLGKLGTQHLQQLNTILTQAFQIDKA